MIGKYTIAYTIYHGSEPYDGRDDSLKPQHKKYSFECEDMDLLAAADHGMCIIFDDLRAKNTELEILFRSITLDNAKEVYEEIKPMHGDKDE